MRGILVAAAGLLVLAGCGDGNPEGSAIVTCEDAVKARLKAPSSADFHSGATETKPGVWRVVGDVDAENSFGAKIRTGFVCTVVWDKPTKTAVLGGVTFDN